MNDHLIYNSKNDYWKDVYKNKIRFASKKDGTVIPWDIKTVDSNLKELLESLNLNQGKLLELGCGYGYDSIYLAEQGFDVSAIDVSEDAIQLAKHNSKHLNINFIAGDAFTNLPKEQFDVVYDRGFLHNFKNQLLEVFEKVSNVITDKGKFIIITGNPNQPELETCMPPPIFLGEIEYYSSKWFKVVSAKEITFEVDENYENCLGYLFLLEKKIMKDIK